MSFSRGVLKHAGIAVGVVSVFGCHRNDPILTSFQQAASELPAALAAANNAGLATLAGQLDRITPPGKNGAPTFQKAFMLFKYDDRDSLRSAVFTKGRIIPKRAAPALAKFSGLFILLRKAAAYPYCNFGPHGSLMDSEYREEEQQNLFYSTEMLCIDADYRAFRGDMKGCEADLTTCVHMESHLLEDLGISGDLPVRLVESVIIRTVRKIMAFSQGDSKNAKDLLGILNQTPAALDYGEALKSETAYNCQRVVAYMTMTPPANDPDETLKAVWLATSHVPKKTAIDGFLTRMLQLETKLERASKRPGETLLQRSKLVSQIQNEEDHGDATHTFNIVATDEEMKFHALMDYVAQRNTAITALKLILNHAPGTPWPAKLPEDAPLDVWSDKPLGYRLTAKGFVVGPNGKDYLKFSYPGSGGK